MDQYLDTSTVEVLNPTWHSAAGVVWGNSTVTMAGMWESFVKVEFSKYRAAVVKNYQIVTHISGLIGLIVTYVIVTPCRYSGDCGHRPSQWSTSHWIHCEPHLPHTPKTTWGGGYLSVERLCFKHISSCCQLQPPLCHSHH